MTRAVGWIDTEWLCLPSYAVSYVSHTRILRGHEPGGTPADRRFPQGFVPPAFVPGLAARLGMAPEALVQVVAGSRAIVDGGLFTSDELSVEVYESHTGIDGLRRCKTLAENWIRRALPLLSDAPMAYDLVQRWLLRAQVRRARLVELDAPPILIRSEEWHVKESIDALADLARGGPMRWRRYVDAVDAT